MKGGIPSVSKYILQFESKKPVARILSAKPATFKKGFSLKLHKKKLDALPPYEGQSFHITKVRGLRPNGFIGLGDYIDQLLIGGCID